MLQHFYEKLYTYSIRLNILIDEPDLDFEVRSITRSLRWSIIQLEIALKAAHQQKYMSIPNMNMDILKQLHPNKKIFMEQAYQFESHMYNIKPSHCNCC
jgi:hypothetical protein